MQNAQNMLRNNIDIFLCLGVCVHSCIARVSVVERTRTGGGQVTFACGGGKKCIPAAAAILRKNIRT